MAQRIARAALYWPTAEMAHLFADAARFAIVAGSAAALILAGPFLPF